MFWNRNLSFRRKRYNFHISYYAMLLIEGCTIALLRHRYAGASILDQKPGDEDGDDVDYFDNGIDGRIYG